MDAKYPYKPWQNDYRVFSNERRNHCPCLPHKWERCKLWCFHIMVKQTVLHLNTKISLYWKSALGSDLANAYRVFINHDDVIKWKHFPRYWSFARGIHRSPVNPRHKGPVTRSVDVFFDLCLNKRLRKQSWGWWSETLSRPFWRHCNG